MPKHRSTKVEAYNAIDKRMTSIEENLGRDGRIGRILAAVGLIFSILGAIAGAYYGAQWSLTAAREDHLAYIDARRPCIEVEEQVFDLPYIAGLTLSSNDTGYVTFARNNTPLHLYAVRLHNNGTGNLHDIRLDVVLPGNAYVTTTTRREAEVNALPGEVNIVFGGENWTSVNISRDPRMTHSRGFETRGGQPLPARSYEMPSGLHTPDGWSAIFHWSPNVGNAAGNQRVSYELPVLPSEGEWWIGTWYYQHFDESNEYDKGAILSAWSQGYDGPLYASSELTALYDDAVTGRLPAFCEWSG